MNVAALMRFFYFIPCHRLTPRCFHVHGKTMPICSRCFGIVVGAPIALLFWVSGIQFSSTTIMLACIPMVVDWSLQTYFKIESNNKRRFVTGLVAGYFLAFFMFDGMALTAQWFCELIREAI